jgi:hypothetical protein
VEASLGVDVVQEIAAGGVFLDRMVLTERSISSDVVTDALGREMRPGGRPLFADIYPSFAVAFSRYCR